MANRRAEQHPQYGEKEGPPCCREGVGGELDCSTFAGSSEGSGAKGGEHADDERVGGGGGAGKEDRSLSSTRNDPAKYK